MTTNSVYGSIDAYMDRSDLKPLIDDLMRALGAGVQVTVEKYRDRHHSVVFSLLTGEDIDQAAVMDAVRAITEGGVSRGESWSRRYPQDDASALTCPHQRDHEESLCTQH